MRLPSVRQSLVSSRLLPISSERTGQWNCLCLGALFIEALLHRLGSAPIESDTVFPNGLRSISLRWDALQHVSDSNVLGNAGLHFRYLAFELRLQPRRAFNGAAPHVVEQLGYPIVQPLHLWVACSGVPSGRVPRLEDEALYLLDLFLSHPAPPAALGAAPGLVVFGAEE